MNDNHKRTSLLMSKLRYHCQHDVEIVQYVVYDERPTQYALVCNKCKSIIFNTENYDLEFIGEDLKEYKNV